MGKSQMYNFIGAVKVLGDDVTEDQLNRMGISKALVLRHAKMEGGSIPEDVISAAIDPKITIKDIKKLLYDSHHISKPEDGSWMSLDFSCYVSDSEREEINNACNAARHTDPPISPTLKDFMQRKQILLRFAREFLGAYSKDVIDSGQGF